MVSAAVILALVAYLALLGWRGSSDRPPEIAVVLDGPRSSGTGWLVPFEASNRGDRPAGQLTLELTAGDERAETTVDFLAAHSSIRGGFFLSGDPGASPLKARALGFVEP